MILNSTVVDFINNKYKNGENIKRSEMIYYENTVGLRKSKMIYTMDPWELDEYIKCKMDVCYFIERYVGVKLHDIQREVITSYNENRFNIYMISKQTGIERLFLYIAIHRVLFDNDKNVLFVQKTMNDSPMQEIVDIIIKLPYYMKMGVDSKNRNRIRFENKSAIFVSSGKGSGIGREFSDVFLNDFAFYSKKKAKTIFDNVLPTISHNKDSRLTLVSAPNGFNKFYEMVRGSELGIGNPDANLFVTKRIYWWEVFGNDIQWKSNMIMTYGQEYWDNYFDMCFRDSGKNPY